MRKYVQTLWADEEGAATVDWIVLTAVAVALALLLLSTIQAGAVAAILQWWGD